MTRVEVAREERMPQVVDVLSEVLADDVVDTGNVARVRGATPRSIARWQAAEVSPRRESEERLLELKAVVDLAAMAALTRPKQQAPTYDPLSGEGARIHGGRINPPDGFPFLCLCSTPACAAGEFVRTAQQHPLGSAAFLPRVLYRYDVRLT
jgi:hypothetical protein